MLLDFVFVFLVGGFICMLGQILILQTKLTTARILIIFVALGVVLQSVGWYEAILDFAGSGIAVPIVGFGATLARGAMEAVASDGFLGIFTGGVSAAAGGIAAAIVFAFLVALVSKSKSKY